MYGIRLKNNRAKGNRAMKKTKAIEPALFDSAFDNTDDV
jgi:hypothetical protein